MNIWLYNTLTGSKLAFQPIEAGKIKIYACGQTVYDYCHIGHARSMLAFDMVCRYLRSQGYDVTLVRNITDIDDKIIKRANENGESSEALSSRYIAIMHEDEKALGLIPVDHEPRATGYIPQIIALIETLLAENAAYIAGNGDVCFSVRQCKSYGKLSKRNIDELVSGARIEIGDVKNDPLDFVLWKLAKPGEPQWESPWGMGRPGWHIECSAMASTLLGQPFDIHGGGMDLKFPHHENEIAQSECAYHTTFANYWMHIGLLNVNGEKMSKSLNNFFTIRDVLSKYSAEVIRYFMLSAHYRSPIYYSEENMQKAMHALTRFYTALRGLILPKNEKFELPEAFVSAMNDDFNSPEAFAVMFELVKEINSLKQQQKMDEAAALAVKLKNAASIFGLLMQDPEVYLQGDIDDSLAQKVTVLIQARNDARKNKNYEESDRIRDELKKMNIVIEDTAEGTTWRVE